MSISNIRPRIDLLPVIILAGGLGTRISEETSEKPKPLIQIGGKPIIWHIMKIYQSQIACKFLIAGGYKWESFLPFCEVWKREGLDVEVIDTGLTSSTGGRVKIILEKLPDRRVAVTYGDGVANINLNNLLRFHEESGLVGSVTAVRPPARFGSLEIEENLVTHFGEKLQSKEGWINGGYFIFEPEFLQYLRDYEEPMEGEPLSRLSKDGQLGAFLHNGFWKPMDTLREKTELEELWQASVTPWKMW